MAETIWQAHYPPIIGYAQTAYMLQRNYSIGSLKEQNAAGQIFYWICDETDAEVGFIGISHSDGERIFIHKFYILPDYQGKGAGKSAFLSVIALYPDVRSIQLQVNRHNYKSINFYFGIGFKIIQVADFDIGDGWQMNDFIMEWRKK